MARTTHRKLLGTFVLLGVLLSAAMLWAVSNATAQEGPPTLAPFNEDKVYGLTTNNRLISFNQFNPRELLFNERLTVEGETEDSRVPLTERIVGMDFRPATGQLYGVGGEGNIYIINFRTAEARVVTELSVLPEGAQFGVDFNPTVDRLRVNSDAEQNLRINVDTGETIEDEPLAYDPDDPNMNTNPNVVGAAYTNNREAAFPDGETTLYDIDSGLDILVTQNPANDGTLNTEGPLGRNVTGLAGFDIAPTFGALASLTPQAGESRSRLFRVQLGTGNTVDRGRIGTPVSNIRDIALPLPIIPQEDQNDSAARATSAIAEEDPDLLVAPGDVAQKD